MLTVVAKVVAKTETVQALQAELQKLVDPTRQEKGCIEYTLHQDQSDPAVFLFYEKWESRADLGGIWHRLISRRIFVLSKA